MKENRGEEQVAPIYCHNNLIYCIDYLNLAKSAHKYRLGDKGGILSFVFSKSNLVKFSYKTFHIISRHQHVQETQSETYCPATRVGRGN